MKKKLDDILQGIGSLLGCLVLILTGTAILFILFYKDKIELYIFRHPYLFIGLVILSLIGFYIHTRRNE